MSWAPRAGYYPRPGRWYNTDMELSRIAALANAPRRDRGLTRAIYSYPAKFQAHLPAELIRMFTAEGDLVVDPYAGGGTTGLESLVQGRRFCGVDINPFACLVARVKTTLVDPAAVERGLTAALACRQRRPILDDEDRRCLGTRVAGEVERFAAGADAADEPVRDLLRLALIHGVKIGGRRDFESDSLLPLVKRRVAKILEGLQSLPPGNPAPRFRCGSSHALPEVADGSAALVVTSPPYKDLDVEYGLLQIQRPALNRSKRSRLIWALLGVPERSKTVLCGGRGETYWEGLVPALREVRRVLARRAPAFFWIGFKTIADRDRFAAHLGEVGLPVRHMIPARLGSDRVASSRSTHHGRDTGMLERDYLIACGA